MTLSALQQIRGADQSQTRARLGTPRLAQWTTRSSKRRICSESLKLLTGKNTKNAPGNRHLSRFEHERTEPLKGLRSIAFAILFEFEKTITQNAPTGNTFDLIYFDDGMVGGSLAMPAKVVMAGRTGIMRKGGALPGSNPFQNDFNHGLTLMDTDSLGAKAIPPALSPKGEGELLGR